MTTWISPTLRRHRLARRLRELRERSGLTLEEAARRLDKTRSALSRIEQGKTRADVHLVRTMMDVYDVRDDRLLGLARDAVKKGWWQSTEPGGRGFLAWETEACESLNFQALHIQGLLQTESYMRALFSDSWDNRSELQIEHSIANRLRRQRRLTDPDAPLKLVALIDESALRWPVGGTEVMRAQLRYLIERAELDTVTLQVLAHGPKPHTGMAGSFAVLRFTENEDPDILFVDNPITAIYFLDVKGVEEVKEARRLFDHLRSRALSPCDSVALIERVAREHYA